MNGSPAFDPWTALFGPPETDLELAHADAEGALLGWEEPSTAFLSPDEITDFWVAEWRARARSDKDALILGWGPSGSGKSTGLMDLARRVDPTFTPANLRERVAFTTEDILGFYGKVPRYGAAIIDEAASAGLLATQTFSVEQQVLVEQVNIMRAANVVLFCLIPNPADLAKAWRARRADYRVEFVPIPVRPDYPDMSEGEAWIGRRVWSRQFSMEDPRWYGFRDDPAANPYTWPDYRTSTDPRLRKFWAAYLPLKKANMKARTAHNIERIRRKKAKDAGED